MEEFKGFSPLIEEDIYDKISIKTCIDKRQTIGAPSPEQVNASIKINEGILAQFKEQHEKHQQEKQL